MVTTNNDKTTAEAAGLRGEAKAYTALGALGGGTWVAVESGVLDVAQVGDLAISAANSANGKWKNLAFLSGCVGIGALIYATIKHSHADEIEKIAKNGAPKDWVSRVQHKSSIETQR